MSTPLVSVLTPSFQQATWLADNLRSVATQTYPRVEHLVMDGGSSDTSVEILRQSERKGLRWWTEPDRGQSHALNKAFALSKGEIIGWLNSDDAYYSATVVADVVATFEKRPDAAVVYGHAALVNADGLLLHYAWAPPFSRRLLKLHDYITQPAAFVRRDALGEQIVDESFDFAMDYELWLRLSANRPFARLDRVVAVDRHHRWRKSEQMLETLEADLGRLGRRYGVHTGRASGVARQAWKIASRFAGGTILPRALREAPAFDRHIDGRAAVLGRQIGMRRSSMPVGGGNGDSSA